MHGTRPRVWTVEALMAATQCTDQELLSRCCCELVDDGHLRPKLLPLRLTREQMAEMRTQGVEFPTLEAAGRAPEGRVMSRAELQEGRRLLGRMEWAALQPTAKKTRKKKPRPIGRPRVYDHDFFCQMGRNIMKTYRPKSLADLCGKVWDECRDKGIAAPDDTVMKELLGPIYRELPVPPDSDEDFSSRAYPSKK